MNSSLTIACKAWTQRGHCVGTACYVRVVHCTCTLCVCNAVIPLIGSVVPLLWMRPCLINNITILRKPKETSHHLNSGRKECKFRFTASKFDNLKKAKKGVMKSLQLTTSMQTCSSWGTLSIVSKMNPLPLNNVKKIMFTQKKPVKGLKSGCCFFGHVISRNLIEWHCCWFWLSKLLWTCRSKVSRDKVSSYSTGSLSGSKLFLWGC